MNTLLFLLLEAQTTTIQIANKFNWPYAICIIGVMFAIGFTMGVALNGWPSINIHKHYDKEPKEDKKHKGGCGCQKG